MQMVELSNRVAHYVRGTDQSLAAHHYSAVQENRALVVQLRRLLFNHLRGLYPTTTRHLHVWLVLLERVECLLANHAFVGAAIESKEMLEQIFITLTSTYL